MGYSVDQPWDVPIDKLVDFVHALLAMLRAVEWNGPSPGGRCPVCDRRREEGHAAGCRISALMSGKWDRRR